MQFLHTHQLDRFLGIYVVGGSRPGLEFLQIVDDNTIRHFDCCDPHVRGV